MSADSGEYMDAAGGGHTSDELVVRLATQEDSQDMLFWRNDPYTCAMCGTREIVSATRHQEWFSFALRDPLARIFIGEFNGKKLGVCRFNFDPERNLAEVSINMNPLMRGKGLSKEFLRLSVIQYYIEKPIRLIAQIRRENNASIKLFASGGFTRQWEDAQFLYFSASEYVPNPVKK